MLVASSAPKPTSSAHAASAASAAGNKPVRRVQFNPHVSVRRLPHEHYDAACKARDGGWKEAPLDDELWDGDMAQFRPKELMPEELKRIVRAKRVSSLPKGVRKPLLRVFKVMKKWGVLEGVDMVGAHAKHLDDEPDVDDNGHNAGSGGVGGDAAGLKPLRLARKVSGSLRSPTPLSAPLDGDLEEMVTRYRSLTVLADALRGKREQEIQAENALALSKHELAVVRQRLRQLRHEIPDLEARVYRNANPRLLHYLQFDREDKVKRLQADLDRTYAEKTEAQAKVESLANLISEQTASHERIKVELSTLVEAERERRQIMDSVLSVTAPSSELALLESQVLDCIAQLNSEEALMAAVKGTRQEIEQAREGFISALALLAEAGAVAMRPPAPAPSSPVRPTKRVGSVPVVTSRTPWSGNKSDMPATRSTASLEGAPEEDAERLALMRQALSTRDDKINKARDLSLDSARRMTAALDVRSLPLRPLTRPAQTFPAAGRDRIPALYSSLTLTAIPDLTQPDLFGPQKRFTLSSDAQVAVQMSMRPSSGFGFGKAMTEKITRKSDAVKMCKEISIRHLDALKSADLSISARVRELRDAVLVKLQQDLQDERRRSMDKLCAMFATPGPPSEAAALRPSPLPSPRGGPPTPPPAIATRPTPPLPGLQRTTSTSVSQVFPKIVPTDLDTSDAQAEPAVPVRMDSALSRQTSATQTNDGGGASSLSSLSRQTSAAPTNDGGGAPSVQASSGNAWTSSGRPSAAALFRRSGDAFGHGADMDEEDDTHSARQSEDEDDEAHERGGEGDDEGDGDFDEERLSSGVGSIDVRDAPVRRKFKTPPPTLPPDDSDEHTTVDPYSPSFRPAASTSLFDDEPSSA